MGTFEEAKYPIKVAYEKIIGAIEKDYTISIEEHRRWVKKD